MRTADPWESGGLSFSYSPRLQTWPRRYGFALLVVAAATLMRFGIGAALGLFPPFVLFFPAIILVALLAGFGPGAFAALLSAVSVAVFFWSALNVFGTNRLRDIVGLVLFSAIGTGFSRLADLCRRREARLREFQRVVQGLEEMIAVVDREYRYVIANDAFLKYRGMKREQVVGRHAAEILGAGVFEETIKQKIDECFQGKVVQYEMRYRYPSLGERDLFISYFPIEGPKGVDRVACMMQDVTDKKRAAEQLRASEDRYRLLFEKNIAGVAIASLDGRVLDCNDAWAHILGYRSAAEVRGQLTSEFYFNPADRGPLLDELRREQVFFSREMQLRRKDDTPVWVLFNCGVLPTNGASVLQATMIDISERKQAEEALQKSEERFRSVYENSSIGIYRTTADGKILLANPSLVKMLGFSSFAELAQRNLEEEGFEPGYERAEFKRRLDTDGEVTGLETSWTRRDGTAIFVRESVKAIRDAAGKIMCYEGTVEDITQRKRAEDALRKSEAHFRLLVEQASDGIFLADAEGRYEDVNSAGAEMLGYTREEILHLSIADVIAVEEVPRIPPEVARFAGGAVARSEWKFRRKDGSYFPGEVVGRRLPDGRLQGILRDMTERKRAEQAVRDNEVRFRVALTNSPITVFNQDRELRYTWIYNPRLYWGKGDIGKTDDEIMGADKAAHLNALKRSVLERGVPRREEVVIPYNGKKCAFDVTVEPLFDSARNIVGITGASMDIAQLREIADRLQDARDKLVEEKSYLESEIQAELGFEEVIGQSSALREVLKKARVVAPTDSTVLLLGETGTGKELVARAVHSLSHRSQKNFIKLNCAAVPTGLLESELFGHEKGAFTGAVNQKVGRIELADKGTLFLDEVGELPPELQPKLLRVLQDREFERLGGVQTLRVDVRIIAATNRDLQQDVTNRKFREDLFYRLNVFPIELPPLRQRRADIPMLVYHFVHKHAGRMGKQIETIPDETMSVLENWSWPGNIRELENMIERMVILTKGHVLAAPPMELDGPQGLLYDNLTEMEREHIIRVLRETNGVLSGVDGAASRLGVKRTTLQSMLKRLGIEAQQFRHETGTFGPE